MLPKFSYSNSISVAVFSLLSSMSFTTKYIDLYNQSHDCLNLLSDAPGYTNPKLFESLNNLHSLNITSGNRFLFPYRTP